MYNVDDSTCIEQFSIKFSSFLLYSYSLFSSYIPNLPLTFLDEGHPYSVVSHDSHSVNYKVGSRALV
ncbi:hypothetical protein RhiirC2_723083 [Rhizophagus irregularis]|uniref:Uncharacterized protein n=1 Tax=Rhizophagus irregularis TaxID=588596 RepID=A0A2N1P447_9GLOM|nr:hypothetical protein RhiirC2_723083 [Rhizophagus irregularis]